VTAYLADTHVLLWALNNPRRLSPAMVDILADAAADVRYSHASLWEMAIKFSLGKLDLAGHTPEDVAAALADSLFDPEPLDAATLASSHRLPRRHQDPFDRLLVWQAIQHDLVLLTADTSLETYAEDGLRLIH
jgi:PIN domain nuclease of toxin-antitoxin system